MNPRSGLYVFAALFLIIGLSSSCASYKTARQLNDIDTYIQERPDSALATIRSIDTATVSTPRLRAHYALLHAMALDKNWIDTTDSNIIMPAITYYDRHPSGIRRAKAWYYLGRIQENAGLFPEASISLLKAEKYADPFDDIAFKSLVYQAISNVYSKTHFHDEALRYTKMSYETALMTGDTLGADGSLYRMAQDYNNLGRYAEADSLYCYLMEGNRVHPNIRSALLCGYGLLCITYKEDYEQAVQVFEEVLDTWGSLRNYNSWGAYAYALMRVGRTQKAEQLFKQLESRDNERSLSYKTWKSLSEAYQGDFLSAYYHQKKASEIQQENVKEIVRQSSIKAQKDFLEQMNQETERVSRHRQIAIWGCSVLFLVVLIILLLYFRRRKEKDAQEKEALIETYKALTTRHVALDSQYSALSAQVDRIEEEKAAVRNQYIQMCQSYFSHIGRVNEILSVHAKDYDNSLYQELKKSIQRIGKDDRSQSEFEKMLNESFDDVMIHFREEYPDKKPRYYKLVSFLFAGFDAATISAIIPNYQKHNVYVEKHRLKQMLLESDTPHKDQYLQLLS